MTITVAETDNGNTMIMGFSGRLTLEDWPEFKNKCLNITYPSKLILDLRDLKELNAAGVGMVLHLRDLLTRKTEEVILLACNERIRMLLNCANLKQWFTIPEGCERSKKNSICGPGSCSYLSKHS